MATESYEWGYYTTMQSLGVQTPEPTGEPPIEDRAEADTVAYLRGQVVALIDAVKELNAWISVLKHEN